MTYSLTCSKPARPRRTDENHMNDDNSVIYRIIFQQDGKIYEVYSRYATEETLVGFLEIDELILEDTQHGGIVLDPTMEKLRKEFKGVKRSYIPIHHIIRLDEINPQSLQSSAEASTTDNVSPFPTSKNRHRNNEDTAE